MKMSQRDTYCKKLTISHHEKVAVIRHFFTEIFSTNTVTLGELHKTTVILLL